MGWLAVGTVAPAARAAEVSAVSAALPSLVDRLSAGGADREAARFARYAVRPDAPYAASLAPDARNHALILDAPTVYAAEARLDADHLSVREAVVWTNRSGSGVDRLVLRVGAGRSGAGVRVRGVTVDGRSVHSSVSGTALVVRLHQPAQPGDAVRLALTLDAQIPAFALTPGWTGPVNAEVIGAFGRHGDVLNLGGWLPLVVPLSRAGIWDDASLPVQGESGWTEPAVFDVWLDAPADWAIATTGVAVAEERDGDRQRVHAVASAAREFALEAGWGQQITTWSVDGLRVRLMTAAAHPEIARDLRRIIDRALPLFIDRFGPLPMAELDVVDAPVNVALGLEYPGLVTIDTHRGSPGGYVRSRYHEWTLAHELAHQWWSAEVGNDPRTAPWLDEALASWSAAQYWRKEHGQVALDARVRSDIIAPHAELQALGIGDLPANLPADRYALAQYAAIVYGRASLFFEALVTAIGDEEVYGALRAYADSNHCRRATASDLLGALRASAERPAVVDALYQRWIVEAHGFEDLLGPAPAIDP